MTKADTIKLAQEAGLTKGQHWNKHNMTTAFMCDFANLVAAAAAAAEREACADAVEGVARKYQHAHNASSENIADECADAIRARSNVRAAAWDAARDAK
jgi:hypothetical protein